MEHRGALASISQHVKKITDMLFGFVSAASLKFALQSDSMIPICTRLSRQHVRHAIHSSTPIDKSSHETRSTQYAHVIIGESGYNCGANHVGDWGKYQQATYSLVPSGVATNGRN